MAKKLQGRESTKGEDVPFVNIDAAPPALRSLERSHKTHFSAESWKNLSAIAFLRFPEGTKKLSHYKIMYVPKVKLN